MSTENPSIRFLVILYGDLEYDGRVQRMIEILTALGEVLLVDIALEVHSSVGVHTDKGVVHCRVNISRKAGKVWPHLRFWIEAVRVAKLYRPNVVISEDFFTAFPGWLAAWIGKSRLVYDAHELIIPEFGRTMSRRDAFWYYLERWVVHYADLVIAANPERAKLMAEYYDLWRKPEYMRNIPPHGAVNVSDMAEIARRYPAIARKNTTDRTFLYQGDISLARGLERFVEALTYLPPNYRLLMAGNGPDLERLKELGEPLSKEGRFAMLGRVPHKLLPAVNARADVGIVTYPYEGLNNIYCAPNKLFEYAQAGLPVIATDQPPLKAMISKYEIGITIARNDSPADIAAGLESLVSHREYYCANLPRFVDAHRWEDEVIRVRQAIQNVVKSNRST